MVDTTLTDTVFIRSDSMKIAKDLKVGLTFIGDDTGMLIDPTSDSLVACAGYKYKSRWIGSEDVLDTQHVKIDTFFRQYPRVDTAFKWWNDSTAKCQITFKRDSLSVVGGKLTILGKGRITTHFDNTNYPWAINNGFTVTTDTFATTNHDSIRTKLILIDKDPLNSLFLDSLQHDIIKAIAYQEYAGSYDSRHCNSPYNIQYNHYWDTRIHGADTCLDSHLPCENTGSSATGIMQISRKWHQADFSSGNHQPSGYTRCIWDSLAWNWKINIHNGKYLYFGENFYNMYRPTNPQQFWDSLYTPGSDYTPDNPNKEDLAVYGYNQGLGSMLAVTDTTTWVKKVKISTYVKNVRQYKETRPW
jgi:hypothetical protein